METADRELDTCFSMAVITITLVAKNLSSRLIEGEAVTTCNFVFFPTLVGATDMTAIIAR
jgi:hypothetical protein